MPDNGVLYYDVINGAARPFRPPPAPARREKKNTDLREFLVTVFILVTCIASLGICARLYYDSCVRVQGLTDKVAEIQRAFEQELRLLKHNSQRCEGSVNNLEVVDDYDDENESESEMVDEGLPIEDKFETDNEPPLYFHPPENVKNTAERKQNQGIGPDLHDNRNRKRRSTTSGGKNGKRSLVAHNIDSECENKECDELEIAAEDRLETKQRNDDRKLTAGNSGEDELGPFDSEGQKNSTQVSVEQRTNAPLKLTKNHKKDKIKPKLKADIEEGEEEETQEEPSKVDELHAAAHFGGDTSKYTHTRHAHYFGNGHLYHPDGVFKDWEPSPWMRSLSMDKHFRLSANGTLTVKKSGLYFVYAQIFYSNAHTLSSYRMFRNNEALLQCTVEIHNKPEQTRSTCFTGGLAYLEAHDQLSLKEGEGERITIFEKTKSFFGLFRVNQS